MKIYIVRHGQTDLNQKRILQGQYNETLNDEGLNLASSIGLSLKGIKFDEAISSPLIRSVQTIKEILKNSNNISTTLYLDNRLKEVNVGSWQLKDLNNLNDPDINNINQFFKDPFSFLEIPNGENVYDVMKRTQSFLKELIAKNDDKTYLIGSHGFAIRAMLNFLYENKNDFWQGHVPYNGAFQILEVKNNKVISFQKDVILDQNIREDYYKK